MESNWLQNEFIWKELYAPYIEIIKNYKKKILEALNAYYSADLSESSTIIRNLINDIGDDPFAVNTLQKSAAFG